MVGAKGASALADFVPQPGWIVLVRILVLGEFVKGPPPGEGEEEAEEEKEEEAAVYAVDGEFGV